ncbi:DNA-binding proteins Bright/BRCAA1/RBP1 and proteins containing BRIGHT domain [Saitoella coloradoensis]
MSSTSAVSLPSARAGAGASGPVDVANRKKDAAAALASLGSLGIHGRVAGTQLPTPKSSVSPALAPKSSGMGVGGATGRINDMDGEGSDMEIDVVGFEHDDEEHGDSTQNGRGGHGAKYRDDIDEEDADIDIELPSPALDPSTSSPPVADASLHPTALATLHIHPLLATQGPLAIRHITTHLQTYVPAFATLGAARQRRVVTKALEVGRRDRRCFEKVGWGRWAALAPGACGGMGGERPSSFSPGSMESPAVGPVGAGSLGGSGLGTSFVNSPSFPGSGGGGSFLILQSPAVGPADRGSTSDSDTSNSSDEDEDGQDEEERGHTRLHPEDDIDPLDLTSTSHHSSSATTHPLNFTFDSDSDSTDSEDWREIGAEELRRPSIPGLPRPSLGRKSFSTAGVVGAGMKNAKEGGMRMRKGRGSVGEAPPMMFTRRVSEGFPVSGFRSTSFSSAAGAGSTSPSKTKGNTSGGWSPAFGPVGGHGMPSPSTTSSVKRSPSLNPTTSSFPKFASALSSSLGKSWKDNHHFAQPYPTSSSPRLDATSPSSSLQFRKQSFTSSMRPGGVVRGKSALAALNEAVSHGGGINEAMKALKETQARTRSEVEEEEVVEALMGLSRT